MCAARAVRDCVLQEEAGSSSVIFNSKKRSRLLSSRLRSPRAFQGQRLEVRALPGARVVRLAILFFSDCAAANVLTRSFRVPMQCSFSRDEKVDQAVGCPPEALDFSLSTLPLGPKPLARIMSGADCIADAVAEPCRPPTQNPYCARSGEHAFEYGHFGRSVAALAERLAVVRGGAEVPLSLARVVHRVNRRHRFQDEVLLSGPGLAVQ